MIHWKRGSSISMFLWSSSSKAKRSWLAYIPMLFLSLENLSPVAMAFFACSSRHRSPNSR
jgi:hypothetical protein